MSKPSKINTARYIGHTTECKCTDPILDPEKWQQRIGKLVTILNSQSTDELELVQFENETRPVFVIKSHLEDLPKNP